MPFKRVSDEDHHKVAVNAFNHNEAIDHNNKMLRLRREINILERRVDDKVPADQERTSILGVYGVCAFERLDYFDFSTQCDWPVSHCLAGIVALFIKLLFGSMQTGESRQQQEPKKY